MSSMFNRGIRARLSSNLIRIMKETGCSAAGLSERSGVHLPTIMAICQLTGEAWGESGGESGGVGQPKQRDPYGVYLPTVIKLADGLGCKIDDLLRSPVKETTCLDTAEITQAVRQALHLVRYNARKVQFEQRLKTVTVARISRLSNSVVWRLLRSDFDEIQAPSLRTLVALALALGLPLVDLFKELPPGVSVADAPLLEGDGPDSPNGSAGPT